MPLATVSAGRVIWDRPAILRTAWRTARCSYGIAKTPEARRRILSGALRSAWALAKRAVRAFLVQRAFAVADRKAAPVLARRAQSDAARAASIAATFGNDAEAIRAEIERENYREHFDFARVGALHDALASIGA